MKKEDCEGIVIIINIIYDFRYLIRGENDNVRKQSTKYDFTIFFLFITLIDFYERFHNLHVVITFKKENDNERN